MKSQRLRLKGFEETIGRNGPEIVWTLSDAEIQDQTMLETYWKEKTVDVLVSLDNDETELAGDFILTLFIALGIFSIVAAILNLDWYFQTSGAMTFVKWLGRKGARIFYALLGLGLIACGVTGLLFWN